MWYVADSIGVDVANSYCVQVHALVLTVAFVAVAHGTPILPIAILVFVDDARKAMVS